MLYDRVSGHVYPIFVVVNFGDASSAADSSTSNVTTDTYILLRFMYVYRLLY